MRLQRYCYAALLAVLFWGLIKGFTGDPMFGAAFTDWRLVAYLAVSLAGATIAGVWVADAFLPWSSASMSLADPLSNVARVTIGFIASTVFSIPFAHLVRFLGMPEYSYLQAFERNFMSIIAAVLFALQVVDILIRNYGKRR